MFILSQDKTRIFNMQGHIEGIGYEEENFKKGKKEEIRHTIQVFDGCAEEIAEYECKEDCLIVLYAIFKAIEQGSKTAELPAREEMKEQREALKQYLESGKKLTEWTAELLKELLDIRYQKEMERMGYTNNYEVLDAREFGLPQARERVFTISVLGGEKFQFDELIRTPMRSIDEFLEKNEEVPEVYDVTQPCRQGI